VTERCPVPVIASGGVGSLAHLAEGALRGGADAVLAASIFHLGEFTVAEAKAHLLAAGVAVRPPPGWPGD
jgi:cyclase